MSNRSRKKQLNNTIVSESDESDLMESFEDLDVETETTSSETTQEEAATRPPPPPPPQTIPPTAPASTTAMDISLYDNNIIPHLMLAVVVCETERSGSALKQIQDVCTRKYVKVKQVSNKMGDPSMANLFKQSCAVILLSPEREEELMIKAFAAGRPVLSLNGRHTEVEGVIHTELKHLVSTVIFCKTKASQRSFTNQLKTQARRRLGITS